jgi:hypothetical protein
MATNQRNIGTFDLQQHRRAREVLLGDSILQAYVVQADVGRR